MQSLPGVSYSRASGSFQIIGGCANITALPNLTVSLGSRNFTLTPQSYVVQVASFCPSQICPALLFLFSRQNMHIGEYTGEHIQAEVGATADVAPTWIKHIRNVLRTYLVTAECSTMGVPANRQTWCAM